ncbi:hypothetical protein CGRA01v4_00378 [Colletotrichum graminicola]|nr:hypothetical protein CGRA01v4_00378 [Colletotrichum graminicola]
MLQLPFSIGQSPLVLADFFERAPVMELGGPEVCGQSHSIGDPNMLKLHYRDYIHTRVGSTPARRCRWTRGWADAHLDPTHFPCVTFVKARQRRSCRGFCRFPIICAGCPLGGQSSLVTLLYNMPLNCNASARRCTVPSI